MDLVHLQWHWPPSNQEGCPTRDSDWRLSKVTFTWLRQEWPCASELPLFARLCGRLRTIARRQLFVHSMQVTFDCADGDRQRGRNLVIGKPLVNKTKHNCFSS